VDRTRATVLLALALVTVASGCAGQQSTSPAASQSQQPSGAVVTFAVLDETYRIQLIDAADIEIARRLLRGEEAPRIPNGVVVRGETGVNTGYTWHIDPASVEFADVTTEVCDGKPSDVEAGAITSDRYCPWSAKVIEIAE